MTSPAGAREHRPAARRSPPRSGSGRRRQPAPPSRAPRAPSAAREESTRRRRRRRRPEAQRPVASMRVCHDSPSQDRSANTSTGDATALRTPRPSTRSTFTRSTTPARLSGRPLGGSTARGSDATTPRTETVARWSARSRTGPASRTPDAAASAARASAVESTARVIVPTHAAVNRARVRRGDVIRRRQTTASPAATTSEPAASAITQTGDAPSERATPVQAVRAGTSRRRSAE